MILNYLKNNNNVILYIITSILFLFCIISYNTCNSYKKELQIEKQNIKSLTDSTREIKNKLGKLQYERFALLTNDVERLKVLDSNLYNEVKSNYGETKVITRTVVKKVYINIPLISDIPTKIDESTFKNISYYDTTYSENNNIRLKISNIIKFDTSKNIISHKSKIDTLNLSIKLYNSIIEDNGYYKSVVRTDFPDININIQSAMIKIPELQKRKNFTFGIGIYSGFGNSGIQFGLGINLSYKIFDF